MNNRSANAAATGKSLPPWLFCLLLLTFAIGTDDFVIAGILKEIADDLDVSPAAAGQLITVFSVTYAITAPVMAVLTARLPRRTVLIAGMVVFAALNVGAALAPTYGVLMVFRVLAAITASAMTPAAFSTAASLAPPERIGRFIGTVATGLTFALVVGVPVGTWLGGTFGWRSTMVYVVGLSLVVAAGLALSMPRLAAAPPLTLKQRLSPLRTVPVLAGLVAMMAGGASGLMALVYISPIVRDLSDANSSQLSVLIAVVGIAGIAGAVLGGKGSDRLGPERTLMIALVGQVAATLLLAVLGWVWDGKVSIVLVGLLFACWGIGGWALNSPSQVRLTKVAGNAGTEALALNTSALYVGIAIAGAVGGVALSSNGGTGVLTASAILGLVSTAVFALSFRSKPKQAEVGADLADERA
ncbi:MFS transporter [Amycolatopsis anabasis]|uniref:MFS transporter n=1 Tax=Amycolatopsis anabasis TaxID=1840409 RepID=UPI00131B6C27|nr:MFS transporter [Amycolatopsis anabasis]